MSVPEGFLWTRRKSGDVVITHHGRTAATLRGQKAVDFLEDSGKTQDQELMARVTGNYKRGNERDSRNPPRNRR